MRPRAAVSVLGPGLAMAATGVGAGDLIAALLAGARFGVSLLWVVALGALLKLALNEGIARWQLATGTTLIEAWGRHLGRPFHLCFLVYLILWSFSVGAALMSACGVAAHALLGNLGVAPWAAIHALVALALVLRGRYRHFEGLMKALVGLMVVTLLGSSLLLSPGAGELARGLVPRLPAGAGPTVLGLMGGVGGSVTLLAYGYWIRERGWEGRSRLSTARLDLGAGYLLTGLFGVAVLLLAARALGGSGQEVPRGSASLLVLAQALRDEAALHLGAQVGRALRWLFLLGVWGAVFSSTLGVWQGVPYLFADTLASFTGKTRPVDTRGRAYRGFLLYLALVPMALLPLGRPLWVVFTYTLVGSAFMPLLAVSLLWLNGRRKWVGDLRNGRTDTFLLALAVGLFALLAIRELWRLARP